MNSKTSDPHRLSLSLTESDKYVALKLSIYYAWKKYKNVIQK